LFTGYVADIGLPTSAMLFSGRGFPAVEMSVTYRAPLRLDDQVRGELRVNKRSTRSITWQCDFFHGDDGALAVQVLVTQVPVRIADRVPTPVPLPGPLVDRLDSPSRQKEQG
jgi:acyl-CoA thioesterase FadM